MPTSPPDVELELADPEAAGRVARQAVLVLIHVRRDTEFAQDALLVVSELVTNAVRHTSGACTLAAWSGAHSLRIEVRDSSTELPRFSATPPGPMEVGGRGLHIVDTLATRWGVRSASNGKTVWAEIAH
jgi:anti-sigma regulatory factor (Ser/Thr protein kinase)